MRFSAPPSAALLRAATLTLYLWASAGAVTAVSYLLPSADRVAIGLGVVLFLLFGILLHVVHRGCPTGAPRRPGLRPFLVPGTSAPAPYQPGALPIPNSPYSPQPYGRVR